ncbi:hypothetical protein TrCOL_g6642 [Triparma columacea]|uniref:Uncharacterized protein n=1 Tax=Triparma columacea TaxID=722753 RepID=A0A9W7GQU4_9STRA|nr:hypothetical protein TrCOL_g6642 [Triparma columacea]
MSDREVVKLNSILKQRDEEIAKLKAENAKHASDFAATAMSAKELAAAVNDAANLVKNAAGIVTVVNGLAVTLRAAADRAAAHERAADRVETIEVAERRAVVPKATEDYVDAPEVAAENTAAPESVHDSAAALDEVAAENNAAPEAADNTAAPEAADNTAAPEAAENTAAISNDLAAALEGAMDDDTGPTTFHKMKYQHEQAHEEMVGVLVERGAVEGIIEQSWDTKRANVGVVVHDEQQLVLDYIFTDCNSGVFRRDTIHEERGEKVVLWQHLFLKGTTIVEYLLKIRAVRNEGSGQCVEIMSEDENGLPKEAKTNLAKITRSKNAQRARVDGEIRLAAYEHGQTALTLVGTMEAKEMRSEGRGDVNTVYMSIKGIMEEIEKNFHKPDVVDERSQKHFVEEIIPSPPPLTVEEENMLDGVGGLENMLYEKGKRVKGTLKEEVDKFLWREGDKVWAAFGVTVDKSTEGFVPLTNYPGGGFKDLSKEGFVLGETTGVYFFNEIAPNICRVTRVQTVDLKFTGLLQKAVMDKAIDYLAKGQLVEANRLQEKFRRNGKEVDAEVRGALVERMREGVELEEDQKKVFGELEELFSGEGERGWGPLESPYEGVKMQIKYRQQLRGKKSIALGRALCEVDCAAEEAAAWYFEFCSTERMATDREEGNLARLEIQTYRGKPNEKVVATVKIFPKFISNREFVNKLTLRKDTHKSISVAVWPLKDEVDYGGSAGTFLRGTTQAIFIATNIENVSGIPQCKIELLQHVDAAGHLPKSLVDKKTPNTLGVVAELRTSFNKDEEVDKAALVSLVNIIKNEHQDYTDEEKGAIRKGKEFYEKCKEGRNFDDLKSPDERVKMKLVHVDGASSATGFATTVVDASVEECAAYEFSKLGNREDTRNSKKQGITFLKVIKVNPHTIYYVTTRELGLPGFAPRDFRSKITWCKEDDGKLVIDVADTVELHTDFPVKAGNVLGNAHTVLVFEPLDPIGGVPQTSVTFTTKVDLGGNFYSSIMNKLVPRFLAQVSNMRRKFDRSRDIDASTRIKITSRILEIKEMSTETFDAKFVVPEGKKKVKGALPLSDTWIKVEEKGKGWGNTTVTVGAGLEEAAAYFWDFESRVHQETTGDVERVVEEKKGTWEVVVRKRQKLESKQGVKNRDREFWNVMKLHKMDKDTIVIVMEPIKENLEESDALSNTQRSTVQRLSGLLRSTAQRASEQVAIKFTKRGEKATKVEFVTKVELGSSVSLEAIKLTLERHLDEATEAQRYFIDFVPLIEMSKQVGEAFGADLVWDGGQLGGAHSRKDRERHVEEVCNKNVALREVVKKYPWFVTLLKRARLCELSSNSSVSTKLECVEEKEARVIGNNLMPCLKSRKVIGAGVDRWRLQNRAVGELFEEFPWMEGMFVEIGKGVVKGAPWGLLWRVTVGAVTSMVDLVTDVYVTYMFWSDKKYGYFKASLASLMVSIGFQMFAVWIQNKELGILRVLREWFPILIGFKPAVDAYRVANGEKQKAGQAFDALTEMAFMKGIMTLTLTR